MARDPFFGPNPVVQAMEQRRGYIEQLRQNTSRLAQSYNSVTTQGGGGLRLPEVIVFNCTFVEQPVVAHGFVVETPLAEDDFPAVSAGVYDFQTDSRGYFIGAWVYVKVVVQDDYPRIHHDFTFTGIAMKDLPEYLLDL